MLIYALAVYGKITMLVFRMIEKFGGGSSDVENMIDIQLQQTAAQDKNSKFDYDFHSYGHVVIWRQLSLGVKFSFHMHLWLTRDTKLSITL